MYGKAKLPLSDEVLKHSVFVNFLKRSEVNIEDVLFFVRRFKIAFSANEINLLDEKFMEYQLLKNDEIPKSVWDGSTIVENEETKYFRMDVIWGYLAKQKSCFGRYSYKLLSKIAKLVLVLPHSNAGEERVFSMVRKNKTTFRSSMSFETLSSILIVKLSSAAAQSFKPDKELTKAAKSATYEYNKQHKST